MKRRSFLKMMSAAAFMPAVGGCKLFDGGAAAFDDNLTVLFSDVHINGVEGRPTYQKPLFAAKVAEVLRMDPLPRNALIFGDLAWIFGEKKDYEASFPLVKLMMDAGIRVRVAMGNHDHRRPFFDFYPEQEKTTPVPGKVVSITDLGTADFIMIDSLKENPKGAGSGNAVDGGLDTDMQEWLAAEIQKRNRPFFVGCHHPIKELSVKGTPLVKVLDAVPNCVGYIHGHDHRWEDYWFHANYKNRRIFRHLCLPSTGHWGDIGYALLRTSADRAVVTLKQDDFFFPTPLKPGEARPVAWDEKVAEHRNATCSFYYNR